MNGSREHQVGVRKPWLLLTVFCALLEGCSAQQLHHTGQAWRRSLCADYSGEERLRCEVAVDRPVQHVD